MGKVVRHVGCPKGGKWQQQYGQDYSNGKARWVRTVVLCMGCHAIMGDGAAPENPPAAGAPDPRVAELEGQLQKATEEIAALAAENQRLRLENQVQAPADDEELQHELHTLRVRLQGAYERIDQQAKMLCKQGEEVMAEIKGKALAPGMATLMTDDYEGYAPGIDIDTMFPCILTVVRDKGRITVEDAVSATWLSEQVHHKRMRHLYKGTAEDGVRACHRAILMQMTQRRILRLEEHEDGNHIWLPGRNFRVGRGKVMRVVKDGTGWNSVSILTKEEEQADQEEWERTRPERERAAQERRERLRREQEEEQQRLRALAPAEET